VEKPHAIKLNVPPRVTVFLKVAPRNPYPDNAWQFDVTTAVKLALGRADTAQHSESAYAGTTTVHDYLYYGAWQFLFENGKLIAKTRY